MCSNSAVAETWRGGHDSTTRIQGPICQELRQLNGVAVIVSTVAIYQYKEAQHTKQCEHNQPNV